MCSPTTSGCAKDGDLEADLERNCDPDAQVLTPRGIYRGREGVRGCAQLLQEALGPDGCYEYA
jgi:hypothetical protein